MLRRATIVLLSLGATVVAADEQPASQPPIPSDSTIDEVIVTGKSLLRLHNEAIRAEEAFFKAFNAVNSDHEFDVRCEYRTQLNSHFQGRLCLGEFVATLEAEQTRALLMGYPPPPTYALMAEKTKQLREKLLDAARQSPAVAAALIEAANARTAFEKENARRCEDRVYFCRRQSARSQDGPLFDGHEAIGASSGGGLHPSAAGLRAAFPHAPSPLPELDGLHTLQLMFYFEMSCLICSTHLAISGESLTAVDVAKVNVLGAGLSLAAVIVD